MSKYFLQSCFSKISYSDYEPPNICRLYKAIQALISPTFAIDESSVDCISRCHMYPM